MRLAACNGRRMKTEVANSCILYCRSSPHEKAIHVRGLLSPSLTESHQAHPSHIHALLDSLVKSLSITTPRKKLPWGPAKIVFRFGRMQAAAVGTFTRKLSKRFDLQPRNGRCRRITCLITNLILVLLVAGWAVDARAESFYGSDPLGSAGLFVDPGVTLLNTEEFNIHHLFANPGTGDFAAVPFFSSISLPVWELDLNNLSTLVFGSVDYGIFTANSSQMISRSDYFVDVHILGLFDNSSVSGAIAYADHTTVGGDAASLRFSMTQTGRAISWSGTLDLSPNPSPEPATLLLATVGFLFGSMHRRRRRGL